MNIDRAVKILLLRYWVTIHKHRNPSTLYITDLRNAMKNVDFFKKNRYNFYENIYSSVKLSYKLFYSDEH